MSEPFYHGKEKLSADDFVALWGPDGFTNPCSHFEEGSAESERKLLSVLSQHFDKDKVCLEVGCGGGYWVNRYLVENFREVIGIDVIPRSRLLPEAPNFTYHKLNDYDYSCSPVASNSIDFVWSYGVFCHLPVSAVKSYVKAINRVLRKGGSAVIMLANWEKHYYLKQFIEEGKAYTEKMHSNGWYYYDNKIISEVMDGIAYVDLLPDFRDAILYFKKK